MWYFDLKNYKQNLQRLLKLILAFDKTEIKYFPRMQAIQTNVTRPKSSTQKKGQCWCAVHIRSHQPPCMAQAMATGPCSTGHRSCLAQHRYPLRGADSATWYWDMFSLCPSISVSFLNPDKFSEMSVQVHSASFIDTFFKGLHSTENLLNIPVLFLALCITKCRKYSFCKFTIYSSELTLAGIAA